MVGGLVGLLALHNLFSVAPAVIAVQAASFLLMVWARITFGRRSFHLAANPTEGGLVTNGAYRYIRHPIYTAVCLFTWAGLLAHWSWEAASCGVLILIGSVARIFCEEALLVVRYPEYRQYCTQTWRMVPFLF